MRRAAIRRCALLLQSGGSAVGAAVDPAALAAAGPHAAAAGGHAGRQLWAPWPQAPFHAAATLVQRAADACATDGEEQPQLVKRWGGRTGSKLLPVRPELAAELRPLAALAGVADAAALRSSVAALGPKREGGVVEHGTSVAQLLLRLGVPQVQLAALLRRCPLLFAWPAELRPAVLFGQLAWLGLTAGEAARCFEKRPAAAGMPSFEPAIAVLAELFAAGSTSSSGRSGEQLLGDLLRNQPAAVLLLCLQPNTLQQRISNLVQLYGPHWEQPNKHAVICRALQQNSAVLTRPPEHMLALEAVLQQEVGQQPGDGTRLLATIVQRQTRAASCSPETLRQRAQALVAEFGLERLLQSGPQSLAELLNVDTVNWQRALAVWRLLGVADPAALGLRNTRLLTRNWLAPDRLASLAALQQLLPWQPSVADVVQQFAAYVAVAGSERMTGRLLFLQQEGMLPLLVADKRAAQQQWRQQQQHPRMPTGQAAGEPHFISLSDAANLTDGKLCALLEQVQAGQNQQPAGSSCGTSASTVAERYRAFVARLPQLPAYQQLLAKGAAESRRLAALLPPELAAAAAAPRPASATLMCSA